ncbi:hypothetical protein CJ030_MR3G009522 [Morella rubra]|uniref:DUF1350 domain-containing protein n=1 Tax=Morella rubra TaxID=262757 RepID=A0A6A1WAN9_9ROSI|nr:hypothetical protein CJ030_MR3G009522 [Morella rubra]
MAMCSFISPTNLTIRYAHRHSYSPATRKQMIAAMISPSGYGVTNSSRTYRRQDSCLVIAPSNGKKPRAVIKFLGGAFIGAVPEVTYSYLIEQLAKEGFLIISVPYNVTFDHAEAAKEVYDKFNACMDSIIASGLPHANLTTAQVLDLPLFSVGHSNGALLQVLTGSYFSEKIPKANAIISFNNRPATEAVPYFEQAEHNYYLGSFQAISDQLPKLLLQFEGKGLFPTYMLLALRHQFSSMQAANIYGKPQRGDSFWGTCTTKELKNFFYILFKLGPLVRQMMPIVEASPVYSMARSASGDAWKVLLDVVGAMIPDSDQESLTSLTKFVDQLPSVLNQVTRGISEFRPKPLENRDLCKSAYNVQHTLLVKFNFDTIDETDLLEEVLKPRVEFIGGTLEKVELSGNHITPCIQEPKWQVGYVYTPADAVAQGLKTLSLNETRVLAGTISKWFRRFED